MTLEDFIFSMVSFAVPLFLLQRWRSANRVFRALPLSTNELVIRVIAYTGLLGSIYFVLVISFAEVPSVQSLFDFIKILVMVVVVATGIYMALASSAASVEGASFFWFPLLGVFMLHFGVNLRDEEGVFVLFGTIAGLVFLGATSLALRGRIRNSSEFYRSDWGGEEETRFVIGSLESRFH